MTSNGFPRSGSPTAIARAASPPSCPETASSPYFASALLVLKGAAASALGIDIGGTTEAVKPMADLSGRLTLNSVPAFPSKPQRNAFGRLVDEKVAEDLSFTVFRIPRSIAEEMYNNTMYDAPELQGTPPEDLSLACLKDWALHAEAGPVVRSTGLLGRLELTSFKHNIDKGQFDICFKVHPLSADAPALAEETSTPPFPSLA